jgi:hypothetical protein
MRHLARCGRSDRPTGSNPELPVKSRFYEQVPGVKGSFIFSFIASLSLQLFVVVDPLVLSTVFLFAL